MATSSFLIYHPDVPKSALLVTATAAFDPDYPVEATFTGRRSNYARLVTAATSLTVTYDLGTGNTRACDHLLLAPASPLVVAGVTGCRLQRSANGSTWADALGTASNFQTRQFWGPAGQELVFAAGLNDEFAATPTAARYHRVTLSGPSPTVFPLSKLYFGAAFDMGKEPDSYELTVPPAGGGRWVSPRGHVLMARAAPPKHVVTVEWDGVTDAKAQEFEQKVVRRAARDTVFLWTATYLDPLYDNRLMHVRLVPEETTITRKKAAGDWNDIKAVFEEVVG